MRLKYWLIMHFLDYRCTRFFEVSLYLPLWFVVFGIYEMIRHLLDLGSKILLIGSNTNLTKMKDITIVIGSSLMWISYTIWSNNNLLALSLSWLSCPLFLLIAISLFVSVPNLLTPPTTLSEIYKLINSNSVYRWFSNRLRNSLDCVWFPTLLIFSILPIALLVCAQWAPTLILSLVLYLIVIAKSWGTMDAFEHADGHYRLLSRAKNLSIVDTIIFSAISWFFRYPLNIAMGRIPDWYSIQHNVIHHAEDNGEKDTQSTLRYDRASFFDYLRRINRFALSGFFPVDVVCYLVSRKRLKTLRRLLSGMGIFYFLVILLFLFNPIIALSILFARYFGLMLSGTSFFQEHGMVDINEPQNIYRNSINFISNTNDHGSLGDDIHIEHHLHPGQHWSKYILSAQRNLNSYTRECALGFNNNKGNTRGYYSALWSRDFESLADLFLVLGKPNESRLDLARLLEKRTRPYRRRRSSGIARSLDIAIGTVASRIVPNV